ncbi:MAG: NUDIX hydrolase [bacterium]|nr:NUDIX hydrolase [bacterium]
MTANEGTRDVSPWPRSGSEPGHDLGIFRSRWDLLQNPRTGKTLRRLVLEVADWVNVVALTPTGRYVFVRQYRFGTEQLTLEIPGGVIDPGEAPLACAKRELREETGYEASEWVDLGSVHPNPAFQDNRCHHFLARGAEPSSAQELDPGEDIDVVTLDEDELGAAMRGGEITHALVYTALCRVLDLRDVRSAAGATEGHP